MLVFWKDAMPHLPRKDDTCSTGHQPLWANGRCPCLSNDLKAGRTPDIRLVRKQLLEDPTRPPWLTDQSEATFRPAGIIFQGSLVSPVSPGVDEG